MRFINGFTTIGFILAAINSVAPAVSAAQADELFVSRKRPGTGGYTQQIEGPAVDGDGNLYAQNFGQAGNIGKIGLDSDKTTVYITLPDGAKAAGTRFDRAGNMYVASFNKRTVYVIPPTEPVAAQTYFKSGDFNQPNDLAIADDGTLYASDPKFSEDTGKVWRISKSADGVVQGVILTPPVKLGTTNGIDLSPDGKTLYVGMAEQNELWAFRIDGDKLEADKPLIKFDGDSQPDGLRVDADGNIYVTRQIAGVVSVVSPRGELLREIKLVGNNPSNLTFGGKNGKTVYVTQVDGKFIEEFKADRPGREYCWPKPLVDCSKAAN